MKRATKSPTARKPSALLRLFGPHLEDDEQRKALGLAEMMADGFIERSGFNFDTSDGGPRVDKLAAKLWPAVIREADGELQKLRAAAVDHGLTSDNGYPLEPQDVACDRWTPELRAAAYVAFVIGYRFAQQGAGREP